MSLYARLSVWLFLAFLALDFWLLVFETRKCFVLGFGLATLAVFYYLGAFWGVAWLAFCVFLLSCLNKNDTKNG